MKYNELKIHGEPDFPIEVYHLDHTSPKYEMACHYHSDIELIHVISGEMSVTLNNTAFAAKSGYFVFVNAETLHSAIPSDCVYECIVFNFDFFLSIPERSVLNLAEKIKNHDIAVRAVFDKNCGVIYNNFHNVFAAMNEKGDSRKLLVIGEMYRLF